MGDQQVVDQRPDLVEVEFGGNLETSMAALKNNGVIANLPDDCIIESPGFVDRFGLNMVAGITLPEACVDRTIWIACSAPSSSETAPPLRSVTRVPCARDASVSR